LTDYKTDYTIGPGQQSSCERQVHNVHDTTRRSYVKLRPSCRIACPKGGTRREYVTIERYIEKPQQLSKSTLLGSQHGASVHPLRPASAEDASGRLQAHISSKTPPNAILYICTASHPIPILQSYVLFIRPNHLTPSSPLQPPPLHIFHSRFTSLVAVYA
jgi:hypothetical protein